MKKRLFKNVKNHNYFKLLTGSLFIQQSCPVFSKLRPDTHSILMQCITLSGSALSDKG